MISCKPFLENDKYQSTSASGNKWFEVENTSYKNLFTLNIFFKDQKFGVVLVWRILKVICYIFA